MRNSTQSETVYTHICAHIQSSTSEYQELVDKYLTLGRKIWVYYTISQMWCGVKFKLPNVAWFNNASLIGCLSFPSSSHFPNKLLDLNLWLGVCLGGIHYKTVMKPRTVTEVHWIFRDLRGEHWTHAGNKEGEGNDWNQGQPLRVTLEWEIKAYLEVHRPSARYRISEAHRHGPNYGARKHGCWSR